MRGTKNAVWDGCARRLAGLFRERRGRDFSLRHGRPLALEPLETRTLLAIAYMTPCGHQGATVEQQDSTYTFTFTREAEGDEDLSSAGDWKVYYTVAGVTAEDCTIRSDMEMDTDQGGPYLRISDGDSGSFTLQVTNDGLDEDDETLELVLAAATCGCNWGCECLPISYSVDETRNSATITILDDDWQIKVEKTNTQYGIVEHSTDTAGLKISRVVREGGRTRTTRWRSTLPWRGWLSTAWTTAFTMPKAATSAPRER